MTSNRRKNTAVSVRDRLLQLAKRRGEDFKLILTRYALERLLYRLSQSEYRDRFILKGAMLFARWDDQPYRATRDVDFLGFGDVVTPDPERVEYPTLLGSPVPLLRAYPRETVVAEKYQARVYLGMTNSRMKDFYDLWVMVHRFDFNGATLSEAINNTFARRETTLPEQTPSSLGSEFGDDFQKTRQWDAFLRKGALLSTSTSPSLDEVCQILENFLMPPTTALRQGRAFLEHWQPGGPWEIREVN